MLRAWKQGRKTLAVLRGMVEVFGIVFLYYSNLLMGEFDRSAGRGKTLKAALWNVITKENLAIAFVSATLGYLVFHYLRERLSTDDEGLPSPLPASEDFGI